MDLVGDLDRNLSVDLPLCDAHTRKSGGGGDKFTREIQAREQQRRRADCVWFVYEICGC